MKLVERARAAAVEALTKMDCPYTAGRVKARDQLNAAGCAVEAALAVVGELEEVEVSEQRGLHLHFLELPNDSRYNNGSGTFTTIYMKKQVPDPTVEELARAVVKAWDADQSAPIFDAITALKEKLDKP